MQNSLANRLVLHGEVTLVLDSEVGAATADCRWFSDAEPALGLLLRLGQYLLERLGLSFKNIWTKSHQRSQHWMVENNNRVDFPCWVAKVLN